MYYVYILKCADGHPYVGCTNNLKDRLRRYNIGRIAATINRLPVKLVVVVYVSFQNKYSAYNFEKYLKTGIR